MCSDYPNYILLDDGILFLCDGDNSLFAKKNPLTHICKFPRITKLTEEDISGLDDDNDVFVPWEELKYELYCDGKECPISGFTDLNGIRVGINKYAIKPLGSDTIYIADQNSIALKINEFVYYQIDDFKNLNEMYEDPLFLGEDMETKIPMKARNPLSQEEFFLMEDSFFSDCVYCCLSTKDENIILAVKKEEYDDLSAIILKSSKQNPE